VTARRHNPWLHEYYSRFAVPRRLAGPLHIVFVIGSADISGGTYVIFEHARWLQKHGATVTIAPMFPMADVAADWHPALAELRFASIEELAQEKFDVAIATWWPTVYELPRLRFRHAVYFVQSAEPRFYAESPEEKPQAGLAELTYTFGLPVITIASWLQLYLAYQHNALSFLARNGISKEFFGDEGPTLAPRVGKGVRVLVEGSVAAPMKGVQEAVRAARDAECEEVWLLTPTDVREYPDVDRVVSRIPAKQTAEVYRSCDVLVKLSYVEGMYGPPLEMFHCGGTVVTYDVTGHEEYVEDGVNGLVVPTGDVAGVSAALRTLRADRRLLDSLKAGAQTTAARWPDWEASSAEFGHFVQGIAAQPAVSNLDAMLRIAGARQIHSQVWPDQ
jgi:glycosyltransferase involved in cell wall biosynthesis